MEQKYKAILFFAVILALIGYTTGGTTNYNNYTNDSGLHVNKSGDTMTGTLKVPQIESPTGTAKYYSIYNSTGIWGYYDLIGTIIPLYRHTWSKLYTYQDWDLGDHNISNCLNCAYKSDIVSDGTKVNKTGEINMTGNLAWYNNSAAIGVLDLPVYNLNLVNLGANIVYNVTSLQWESQQKADQNSYALQVISQDAYGIAYIRWPYNDAKNYTQYFQSTYNNTVVQHGNLTISAQNGTGDDYACFDSNGKLFRKNTAC